jgi:uncharacterized membrane protein YGL010W
VKSLDEQLTSYAAYHRNRWNKLTHFVGVPLITFSILIPLGWLRLPLAGFELTGALAFIIAVLVWYFALDALLAAATVMCIAPILYAADRVAQLPLATGLWVFGVTFVGGWVLQLLGHAIEGRRPALADNLLQILVAPIFLLAEIFFALGLKRDVHEKISSRLRTTTD